MKLQLQKQGFVYYLPDQPKAVVVNRGGAAWGSEGQGALLESIAGQSIAVLIIG